MHIVTQFPAAVRGFTIEAAAAGAQGVHELALEDLVVDRQLLDPIKFQRLIAAAAWPPIAVLQFAGVYYVHDGRHRPWLAWLRGNKTVSAELTVVRGSEK